VPLTERRSAWWIVLLAVVTAWCAWFWPRYEIAAWRPPSPPPPTGPLAPNDALTRARVIGDSSIVEAEDVVVDRDGVVYASCKDGWIRTIAPSGTVARLARPSRAPHGFSSNAPATNLRPLGLALAKADTPRGDEVLYAAVPDVGIVEVDRSGDVRTIRSCYQTWGTCFVDDLDQARDGTLYFSTASDFVGLGDDHRLDIASGVGTGMLLAVRPGRGGPMDGAAVVAEGLHFANGVAVAPDQGSVFVAETARYRITRVRIRGPLKGRAEVFAANLPGLPDNLNIGPRGTLWVGFVTPRLDHVDRYLHPSVVAKYAMALAPGFLLPKARRAGLVGELDLNGELLRTLQDPDGAVMANTTGAFEHGGKLYLGRLYNHATGVGVLGLPSMAPSTGGEARSR